MRATTILRRLIGVIAVWVIGCDFEDGLTIDVRHRRRHCRCGVCGRKAPGYDQRPARRWRHLGLGRLRIWLRFAPRRVRCRTCGIRIEQVPWARQSSGFTHLFEELAAYLAQVTDKTAACKLLGINWRTIGAIVERVVAQRLDPKRLDGLRVIGIDEFSYRKRHRYLTIVVDHEQRRVVWASKGKSSETLGKFFEELGAHRTRRLEHVTMDMAGSYIKAVRDHAPGAEIVFDRFHVQKLASDAVDTVRRSIVGKLHDADAARSVKGTRYALLKSPWNLTRKQKDALATVQRTNKPLYRAYLLKEALAKVLDYRQAGRARHALDEWLSWASRSKLKPFIKVARTLRAHKEGVLTYIKTRFTNGIVEGINNRARMVARRAFGFHSAEALIGMIFLCCGGIQLDPPLP